MQSEEGKVMQALVYQREVIVKLIYQANQIYAILGLAIPPVSKKEGEKVELVAKLVDAISFHNFLLEGVLENLTIIAGKLREI